MGMTTRCRCPLRRLDWQEEPAAANIRLEPLDAVTLGVPPVRAQTAAWPSVDPG